VLNYGEAPVIVDSVVKSWEHFQWLQRQRFNPQHQPVTHCSGERFKTCKVSLSFMLSTVKTYSYLSLHKSKDLHAHGPLVEDVAYYIMTAAQAEGVSEGQRAISWIWRTAGVGDSSPAIQEGMYGHSTS
jgi:hypothetical protein